MAKKAVEESRNLLTTTCHHAGLNRDIHEGYYCREYMNRRRIPAGKAVGIKTELHNSEALREFLNRFQLLDKDKNPLVSEEHIIWPTCYENLDLAKVDSSKFEG